MLPWSGVARNLGTGPAGHCSLLPLPLDPAPLGRALSPDPWVPALALSPDPDLRVRRARVALEVAEVTGAVLQAEAGLVALCHFLACGCIQQVIVAELIHAVVVSGGRAREERQGGLVTPVLSETGLESLL